MRTISLSEDEAKVVRQALVDASYQWSWFVGAESQIRGTPATTPYAETCRRIAAKLSEEEG